MSDGRNTYRDELEAAHARIRELEAQIAVRDEDDAASPWFAKLRAERERVVAEGRRFWGLGPDGLGALVVATVMLGSLGLLLALFVGGVVPLAVALVVASLFVGMLVLVLRSGKRTQIRARIAKVDEKLDDVRRTVAIARAGRDRVRVQGDDTPPPAALDEQELEDEEDAPAKRRATDS